MDVTNVQQASRASLIKLAKSHDVLVGAIVIDVPESVTVERNKQRPDRDFGSHVVSRQHRDLKRSLKRLNKEGFRRVHVLRETDQIESVQIVRERPLERPHRGPWSVRHYRRHPRLRVRAPHLAYHTPIDTIQGRGIHCPWMIFDDDVALVRARNVPQCPTCHVSP